MSQDRCIRPKDIKSISFVGAGVMGTSLGFLLKGKGYPVKGISSRSLASAEKAASYIGCRVYYTPEEAVCSAEIIFLTVPDKVIQPLCENLTERGVFRPGQFLFHTSGALSSKIMVSAADQGVRISSLHPLQTFASPEVAVRNLPGSIFALEGCPEAVELGRELAEALGGKVFQIKSEDNFLYHAAACIASNYFVSLVHLSCSLLERIGIPKEDGMSAFLPLLKGTLENLSSLGAAKALTGPVARGDIVTLSGHIEALKKDFPEIIPLYSELGRYTVDVALEKGTLMQEEAQKLKELFEINGR